MNEVARLKQQIESLKRELATARKVPKNRKQRSNKHKRSAPKTNVDRLQRNIEEFQARTRELKSKERAHETSVRVDKINKKYGEERAQRQAQHEQEMARRSSRLAEQRKQVEAAWKELGVDRKQQNEDWKKLSRKEKDAMLGFNTREGRRALQKQIKQRDPIFYDTEEKFDNMPADSYAAYKAALQGRPQLMQHDDPAGELDPKKRTERLNVVLRMFYFNTSGVFFEQRHLVYAAANFTKKEAAIIKKGVSTHRSVTAFAPLYATIAPGKEKLIDPFLLRISSAIPDMLINEGSQHDSSFIIVHADDEPMEQSLEDIMLRWSVPSNINNPRVVSSPEGVKLQDGCLLELFINTYSKLQEHHNKKRLKLLNDIQACWEMCTDRAFEAPYELSLKEIRPLAEYIGVNIRGFDLRGALRYEHAVEKPNQNLRGVPHHFNVCVHHRHAYNYDMSDNREPVTLRHTGDDYSQQLPDMPWKFPKQKEFGIACIDTPEQAYELLKGDKDMAVQCFNFDTVLESLMQTHTPSLQLSPLCHLHTATFHDNLTKRTLKMYQPGEKLSADAAQRNKFTENFGNELNYTNKLLMELFRKGCDSPFDFKPYKFQTLRDIMKSRGPLVKHRLAKGEVTHCIDLIRAYAAWLFAIKEVGVFTTYDQSVPYNGEELQNCSIYRLHVETPDGLLFTTRLTDVTGYCLKEIVKFFPVEIVGVIHPSRIQKIDAETIIREIYADENLTDSSKKMICNLAVGMAGKTVHRTTYGELRLPNNEEEEDFALFNDHILKLRSKQANLTTGFLALSHMILDINRLRLKQLADRCPPGSVVGVNVDCVLLNRHVDMPGFESCLENIGKNKPCEEYTRQPCDVIGGIPTANKYTIEETQFHEPVVKQLELKDERDTEELRTLNAQLPTTLVVLDRSKTKKEPAHSVLCTAEATAYYADSETFEQKRLMVRAKYPGAGKSYAWKQLCQKDNTLIITPWGPLAQSLRTNEDLTASGWNAIHIDSFLAKKDSTTYNNVVFEEICLHRIGHLKWIQDYMAAHPETNFYANGDVFQLPPVKQTLAVEWRSKYNHILAKLFPVQLVLNTPKRIAEQDLAKAIPLYDEFLELVKRKAHGSEGIKLLAKHGITPTKETDYSRPSIAFYNSTVDELAAKRFEHLHYRERDALEVGDVLRARVYNARKRINRSQLYAIDSFTQEVIGISEIPTSGYVHKHIEEWVNLRRIAYDNIVTVKRSELWIYFRHQYAETGHALQGRSVGDSLDIYDFKRASIDWLWVAITRCCTLDIRLIDNPEEEVITYAAFRYRLEGHTEYDRNRFNTTPDLDLEWCRETYTLQDKECAECRIALGITGRERWSIDRFHNNKGHTKDNCQLVCLSCQCASGKRS